MKERALTYIIDDRRRLAADLAEQHRLSPERIDEIVGAIPPFRAEVKLKGTPDSFRTTVSGPNGRDILTEECPHYISTVTIPEIRMHFSGEILPQNRKLPFAVSEIK